MAIGWPKPADDPAFRALRRSELIARPLGAPAFVEAIGRQLRQNVMAAKRGPKPRERQDKG